MEKLLKGKPVADAIDEGLIAKMAGFYEKGVVPTLAIVRVGENGSDIAYENGAVKKAKKIGVQTEKFICDGKIEEADLIAVIESINQNPEIHGVLLLQPLPRHIDSEKVRNAIASEKDMDCVSDGALGRFFTRESAFAPCTAESCIEILKHYDVELCGKRAVVIGRSMVIGKPVSLMLMKENATVTVCHTKTRKEDLLYLCKDADIIVAAAGTKGTVTDEMVSPGQVIVDVGINFDEDGKMTGDAAISEEQNLWLTPVPGGVGSVTTSLLMKHVVEAAEQSML
ncbi:bifunctional 5,10-methylenetetrahydrofolate dehydrogenase/5,10-methenyltetrahydrofolate cyclohydrolase [Emergencia sp. 1XD21-10]|uniref:bifunctional 5,10-methylenetetrahydrofolate dehydrogenase/5,10-methenyltetrahydrofolate cyclohydrolase n=1 Tax=Emergencia sp. 1XD21-10 TaxID=2304569 RepID=UPI00137B205C|nr:bifunctional 5,10-methylenetetrahydrofolate dehydrogenase/5,10-methenyltetrahydrofolate cyclohydrolase [Emergencia sp. 1XD21-10]NCE98083.1 bifunctional 5,10-methylenetetrahydrofolate dehydrogenase/5,10-methenyltetrahydrofolate cyclohydrolase [Emergencia sp. 1XD21-10]